MIDFFEVMLLYHRAINLKWQYNYFLISKQVMSGVASEISSKNYASSLLNTHYSVFLFTGSFDLAQAHSL